MRPVGLVMAVILFAGCGGDKSTAVKPREVKGSKEAPLHPSMVHQLDADDPRIPRDDGRFKGRLLAQTLKEEGVPAGWEAPSGNEPVFTRDFLGHGKDLWDKHLAHLKGKPNVRGLEIGSFEGNSAIWFCQNVLTHETASLTCLDLFGGRIEAYFLHNVKVTGVASRIQAVKGRSQETLRLFPYEETFDFIYVDGCHLATCALADIVLSFDLLKVDGLMIIDDYGWKMENELDRPKLAVDAFLQIYEPHIKLVAKEYQVIVRKTSTAFPFVGK